CEPGACGVRSPPSGDAFWVIAKLLCLALVTPHPARTFRLTRSSRRAACPLRPALLRAVPCFAGSQLAGIRRAAGVAELVDALDLGSSIARCGGSSPFARTSSVSTNLFEAGAAEVFGRQCNADRRNDQRRPQAGLHPEDPGQGNRGADRRRGEEGRAPGAHAGLPP